MAYKKGLEYKLYRMTSGTFASPVWTNGEVKAVTELEVDFDPADIEVEERGQDTGHLKGHLNPSFKFKLMNKKGDTNVTALITAWRAGTAITLAVADDTITTTGCEYLKQECLLMMTPLSAGRGEVAAYDVVAYRHADSDFTMTAVTV